MRKIALVQPDQVVKGTKIVDELPEFTKHLQPGDILLSKGSIKSPLTMGVVTEKFQSLRGASDEAKNWTHAGVYMGNGKIRHAYAGIQGKDLVGKQRIRDHKLKTFANVGRDMLAMRPVVSESAREKALGRTMDLQGRGFDYGKILRAGLWPSERSKKEIKKENLPDEVICTSLVGYAYPDIDFKGKSIHTVMPSDIVDNTKMTPVAAFSADPPLKRMAKSLKKKLQNLLGKEKKAEMFTAFFDELDKITSTS